MSRDYRYGRDGANSTNPIYFSSRTITIERDTATYSTRHKQYINCCTPPLGVR